MSASELPAVSKTEPLPPATPLLLAGQHAVPHLLPRHVPPLLSRDPADVRPVAKATNPVHLLDDEPHPVARMDRAAGIPGHGVRVVLGEAGGDGVLDEVLGADVLEVPLQREARQAGGAAHLPLRRDPGERQRDVGAGGDVLEAGGDVDGQDGGVARRVLAVGDVVDQADGRARNVRRAVLLRRGALPFARENGRERAEAVEV